MKKAIIFDLDGTLLNTNLLIKKSFIHTFKKYKPGYTLSEEELLSFLGPSLKNTFSRYVEEDQVDEFNIIENIIMHIMKIMSQFIHMLKKC